MVSEGESDVRGGGYFPDATFSGGYDDDARRFSGELGFAIELENGSDWSPSAARAFYESW